VILAVVVRARAAGIVFASVLAAGGTATSAWSESGGFRPRGQIRQCLVRPRERRPIPVRENFMARARVLRRRNAATSGRGA
jgi:hypothetical protein